MWTFKKEIFKTDNTKPTILCGGSLNTFGNKGIYKTTVQAGTGKGIVGFVIDADIIPDRFEIYYDGNKVADSKYIGNGLTMRLGEVNQGLFNIIGNKNLEIYEFNGSTFDSTGQYSYVTNTKEDIADNVSKPTHGVSFLSFNKISEYPSEVTLIVTGTQDSTEWSVKEFVCPINPLELPNGFEKIFYGPLPIERKDEKTYISQFSVEKPISKKLFINQNESKIYKDLRGINSDFTDYGWTNEDKYFNDGNKWYETDSSGLIIASGLVNPISYKYWGAVSQLPLDPLDGTQNKIYANNLNKEIKSSGENVFNLLTGAIYNKFIVLLPPEVFITSVIDTSNSNVDLTQYYILSKIVVKDEYGFDKLYNQYLFNPSGTYPISASHKITTN